MRWRLAILAVFALGCEPDPAPGFDDVWVDVPPAAPLESPRLEVCCTDAGRKGHPCVSSPLLEFPSADQVKVSWSRRPTLCCGDTKALTFTGVRQASDGSWGFELPTVYAEVKLIYSSSSAPPPTGISAASSVAMYQLDEKSIGFRTPTLSVQVPDNASPFTFSCTGVLVLP